MFGAPGMSREWKKAHGPDECCRTTTTYIRAMVQECSCPFGLYRSPVYLPRSRPAGQKPHAGQ